MATYILLLTLTPEGRQRALEQADVLGRAEEMTRVYGIQALGNHGVLGPYDFVSIVEAEDGEVGGPVFA